MLQITLSPKMCVCVLYRVFSEGGSLEDAWSCDGGQEDTIVAVATAVVPQVKALF